MIDAACGVFHDAYVHGSNVPGRATGHQRPLGGTIVEAAERAGNGFAFGSKDRVEWVARNRRFGPVFDLGIRSMLDVPVREGRVLSAALVLASHDPLAYGDVQLG